MKIRLLSADVYARVQEALGNAPLHRYEQTNCFFDTSDGAMLSVREREKCVHLSRSSHNHMIMQCRSIGSKSGFRLRFFDGDKCRVTFKENPKLENGIMRVGEVVSLCPPLSLSF